jgi:shikimate kinase
MTALALANASAHAAVNVVASLLSRIGSAIAWLARVHAEARIHKARREAEMFRNRYRLRTENDDDLPVII